MERASKQGTDWEKKFAAVAVEWTSKQGSVYILDTRRQSTLALGFHPNELVVTPDGLATFIGLNINGKVFVELMKNSEPILYSFTTKEELENAGFCAIRTDREKKFAAVAVEWTSKQGSVYILDTRRQSTLALGFHPNELVITHYGLATVLGVKINGMLLFEVVSNSKLVYFSNTTKEEFQEDGFHPIRTEREKKFVAVAKERMGNDGFVDTVDTRPETMRVFGLHANERILTPRGLATVIGVNIDGKLLMKRHIDSSTPSNLFLRKEHLGHAGIRTLRTDAEKKFAAVAEEWTAKDGELYILDVRPRATFPLGLHPGERIVSPIGLATFIGGDIDGTLVFEKVNGSRSFRYQYKTKEEFEETGFRLVRTNAEKKFVVVAAEWTAKNGAVYTVDTRPQATQKLGFHPDEQVITSRGLATVIGVNIEGDLLFKLVNDGEPLLFGNTCREDFERADFRAVRSKGEKKFIAVAVEWRAKNGTIYNLDTRPEATLALGFHPNERVLTPANGPATVVGLNIDGHLVFDVINASNPLSAPFTTKDAFERAGFRTLRTRREKEFFATAVEWRGEDGVTYALDTRPEATLALGFRPNERVIVPRGLATIIGVDINGQVLFDLTSDLETFLLPLSTRARLEQAGVRAIQTDAEKEFMAVAVEHRKKSRGIILLDTRPETLSKFGFLQPGECFYYPSSSGPPKANSMFTAVGIDILGNIFVNASTGPVYEIPFRSRSECIARGLVSVPPASPARSATDKTAVAKVTSPPVVTTTLPSGAVYSGAYTRAGQRHGNGTMTSGAAGPLVWRYKGQWQQGRPHGSGTLRMVIRMDRGSSTVAVYEGRWVLGVPHGAGTLRVDGGFGATCRRYRGRWVHGRRMMTAVEVTSVRLSGGTALVWNLSTPNKSDVSKRRDKKKASVAPSRPPAPVVFVTHCEVQCMVSAVAATCSQGSALQQHTTTTTVSAAPTTTPIATWPPAKPFETQTRSRALQQFLRQV